jgi:nucleoside-diphosphate-sugar epimerase
LITGHKGYIGSVMVPVVRAAGYDVTGLDTGYFSECTLPISEAAVPEVIKDIRDLTVEDLAGYDAVIHLAALSNDPIGNLNLAWTEEINRNGSIRLAELAKAAGVERFIFSSSCIMYGMTETAVVTEDSPLDPQTEYARSKVDSERAITKMADDGFSPTFMRNGTVYGLSPRMRLDTVLNDFVAQALTTGKVVVMSDGKPWRPVIHVADVARAFVHVLGAPRELIHNQAFNNGADDLNYQIIELAQFATEAVPDSVLEVRATSGADQRTYKADFGKFKRTFPDFAFEWNARSGAAELYQGYLNVGLTREDCDGNRYVRLRWLNAMLAAGSLDSSLRWARRTVNAS